MKVSARFRIVFNVTRDVEFDEAEFKEWARDRYLPGYDPDLAIAAYLDDELERTSEALADWRERDPLPDDFELQYSEVEDVSSGLVAS